MNRITALFVGIAALTVISTVAEAEDGCGRGWYYNGRRCVPMDAPAYGPQYLTRRSGCTKQKDGQ
jgi:hypothetical protein